MANLLNIAETVVSVFVELFDAGLTDDGTPFIAEKYLVVVEWMNGKRWAHEIQFKGARLCYDDEGNPYFDDLRDEAKAAAEKLADRVRAAKEIDPERWAEINPAYGSVWYEMREPEIVAREKREDYVRQWVA